MAELSSTHLSFLTSFLYMQNNHVTKVAFLNPSSHFSCLPFLSTIIKITIYISVGLWIQNSFSHEFSLETKMVTNFF